MFEKEADYAETRMIVECDGKYAKFKKYKDGFKDGAEFGYNKANEWHYPSKGKLPEKDNCLCIGHFGNDDYAICKVKGGRFWISSCGWLDFEDATAWRYIEPPKEE